MQAQENDLRTVQTLTTVKPALELVEPIEQDGVRFYVSSDGTQVGLSQSGIAKLAGVGESSIRSLLGNVAALQLSRSTPLPNTLAQYAEQEVYHPISSRQQERVVRAEIAAAVIEYYAYESPRKSEQAQYAYRAFARVGIERWIKDTVGYKEPTLAPEVTQNQAIMLIMNKLTALESRLERTAGYEVAAQRMPGLVGFAGAYHPSSPHAPAFDRANDTQTYTISEWVELMGYKKLTRSDIHYLAVQLSATYRAMFLEQPRRRPTGVQAYPRKDFPLLESAYLSLQMANAHKKSALEARKAKQAAVFYLSPANLA